ncbi:MAG: hypothetical protein LBH92_00320 [Bacteroidales bacterium]|jgi:hypothetical protein|nr:hypothetical protein [Bacteroidales bacterium]
MNDVFSFKRFALSVKAYWIENKKRIILKFILIPIILMFLFLILNSWKPIKSYQYDFHDEFIFITFCGAFLCGNAIRFFNNYSTKREMTMFSLSIPTAPLERLLIAFCYVMIFIPLILISFFFIIDFIAIGIFNNLHQSDQIMFKLSDIPASDYIGFATIASVILFGSLFFKKYGGFISIILIIIFLLLQISITSLFLPREAVNLIEFGSFEIIERGTGNRISINGFMQYFNYLLLPLCWILSYMKLREKEA